MPYLPTDRRREVILEHKIETPGDLNFRITHACLNYIDREEESYQAYNDVIGALECAKLEMYRRRLASYEDAKCRLNGDVYEDHLHLGCNKCRE